MRRKRALPSLGIGIGIAAAAALAGAGSATDPLGQQETISDEGGRP